MDSVLVLIGAALFTLLATALFTASDNEQIAVQQPAQQPFSQRIRPTPVQFEYAALPLKPLHAVTAQAKEKSLVKAERWVF